MVDTVKFNVGGRHFEVSRALIDQNPDTMLAKMISETWKRNPDKPMFIDRDGAMFAQVLNYLRYGSIDLSALIPQSMFMRELDYYAIPVKDGSVTGARIKTFAEVRQEVRMNYEAFELAVECQERYYHNAHKPHFAFVLDKKDKFYQHFSAINRHGEWKKTFEKYLNDYFGLTVTVEGSVVQQFSVAINLK